MTALGVHLRISGPEGSFERAFERPPVFIGRRPSSDCILDGSGVSKTHTCVDIRGDAICVRDCGSANGTFLAGNAIERHRWVRAGARSEAVEIRISAWTVVVTAFTVTEAPVNRGGATLTDLFADRLAPPQAEAPPPIAPGQTVVMGAPGVQAQTVVMSGARPSASPPVLPLSLDAHYADMVRALRPLYESASHALADAPLAHRRGLCDQIATRYPLVVGDPAFAALLRSHGWSPSSEASPLASSALESMQELARWYLGPERMVGTEAEVGAFKEHQRRALDELLIGFMKLVTGLDQFEQQMSLRQSIEPAQRTPADLIRDLLDWRRSPDAALQHVRASFADLMMHQVALLQGVMRGVKALLTELAPATIEALAKDRPRRGVLRGRPDPWSVYKERHADFSDEESERFRVLFGAEFAEEYRQLAPEMRPVQQAEPRPSAAPPRDPSAGQTAPLNRDRRA